MRKTGLLASYSPAPRYSLGGACVAATPPPICLLHPAPGRMHLQVGGARDGAAHGSGCGRRHGSLPAAALGPGALVVVDGTRRQHGVRGQGAFHTDALPGRARRRLRRRHGSSGSRGRMSGGVWPLPAAAWSRKPAFVELQAPSWGLRGWAGERLGGGGGGRLRRRRRRSTHSMFRGSEKQQRSQAVAS